MKLRMILILVLPILILGCAREEKPANAGAAPAKSTGSSPGDAVVDIVTRRDAVEAGKKARATIDAVQARRQQDFEEALGENK